jgi:hypothetical protein
VFGDVVRDLLLDLFEFAGLPRVGDHGEVGILWRADSSVDMILDCCYRGQTREGLT